MNRWRTLARTLLLSLVVLGLGGCVIGGWYEDDGYCAEEYGPDVYYEAPCPPPPCPDRYYR